MNRVGESRTVLEDVKKYMGEQTPWHVARRKKETTPGLKQLEPNYARKRQKLQYYNVTIYIIGKPSMTAFKPEALECRNTAISAAGTKCNA